MDLESIKKEFEVASARLRLARCNAKTLANQFTNLSMVDSSPATVCWNLLQMLLEEYEEPHLTVIHKVVCRSIIGLGAFLPHWLLASYKQRNPAELLRLLMRSGRVLDASSLAREYLWAALGKGREYFGIQHEMVSTKPALCLPLNAMEVLIYQLKYQEEHSQLDKLFREYLKISQRVSNDMVRIGWSKIM
ncbi:Nucleoporin 160kD [Carabus blaptoides fortunei]